MVASKKMVDGQRCIVVPEALGQKQDLAGQPAGLKSAMGGRGFGEGPHAIDEDLQAARVHVLREFLQNGAIEIAPTEMGAYAVPFSKARVRRLDDRDQKPALSQCWE
jgi:hypothetical protein